jgi:hypothetical protein
MSQLDTSSMPTKERWLARYLKQRYGATARDCRVRFVDHSQPPAAHPMRRNDWVREAPNRMTGPEFVFDD